MQKLEKHDGNNKNKSLLKNKESAASPEFIET